MMLRSKMLALLLPPVVILVAALILFAYTQQSRMAKEKAQLEARTHLGQEARKLSERLNFIHSNAVTIARQVAHLKASGLTSRAHLIEIAKKELEDNSAYYGFWIMLEPKEFGQDDALIQARKEADAAEKRATPTEPLDFFATETGAVNIYWTRPNSTLKAVEGDDAQREDSYYKEAFSKKEVACSVYFDESVGKLITTISVPIFYDSTPIGVVGIDLALDDLQKDIGAIKPYTSGYALLFSEGGTIIASPVSSLAGKQHTDPLVKEELSRASQGTVDAFSPRIAEALASPDTFAEQGMSPFSAEEVLTVYEPLPFAGNHITWRFAMSVPVRAIMETSTKDAQLMLFIGALGLLLSSLGIFFVVSNMVKSLREGVTYAQAVAGGDLDQTYATKRTDEIGILAKALATMVANLRTRIGEAEQHSLAAAEQTTKANAAMKAADNAREEALEKHQAVLTAAENLEQVIDGLAAATEQLSGQVTQSRQSAATQRQRVDTCALAMEKMNATVLRVASNAQAASEASERAKAKAQDGERIVQDSISAINTMQEDTARLRARMENLGEQAHSIGDVITVINDIADQTNLLALNAAIEAARAGEAGRGFAVVADEVRKLAEKTMYATKEVDSAITSIQKNTGESIEAVEQAAANLHTTTGLIDKSGASLGAIVAESAAVADQVLRIAEGTEMQAAASKEITAALEDIRDIAADTAAVMETSDGAVQRVARQTTHIQSLAHTLRTE